jgi:hypothetical protein
LVAAVLVVMLVTAAPQVMLFALFGLYAASGVVMGPVWAIQRRGAPSARHADEEPVPDDDLGDFNIRTRP